MKNKIIGICIILVTCYYANTHWTGNDRLGLWEHWTILWAARKINVESSAYLDKKIALNERAIHSAPSPWLLQQRIALNKLAGISTEVEQERLFTIFNQK